MTAGEPRILEQLGLELWAVHKPAHMRVHPAVGKDDDLTKWLAAQGGLPPDVLPAHRVDADASGVVLCGTRGARRMVGEWFQAGQIGKVYLVVVHGRTRKKGVVQRALPDQRRGRPLEAVTRYRRIEKLGGYTLLEVTTETGRKHQIRRHLAGIGHPVVGDARRPPRPRRNVPGYPDRLWLHAWKLSLPGGRWVEDPLPDELVANLDALRAGLRRLAEE